MELVLRLRKHLDEQSPIQPPGNRLGPLRRRLTEEASVTPDGIALRHSTTIDEVWSTLIEVYADVRADQLHLPHYSVERFGEQLARHASDPAWVSSATTRHSHWGLPTRTPSRPTTAGGAG